MCPDHPLLAMVWARECRRTATLILRTMPKLRMSKVTYQLTAFVQSVAVLCARDRREGKPQLVLRGMMAGFSRSCAADVAALTVFVALCISGEWVSS